MTLKTMLRESADQSVLTDGTPLTLANSGAGSLNNISPSTNLWRSSNILGGSWVVESTLVRMKTTYTSLALMAIRGQEPKTSSNCSVQLPKSIPKLRPSLSGFAKPWMGKVPTSSSS